MLQCHDRNVYEKDHRKNSGKKCFLDSLILQEKMGEVEYLWRCAWLFSKTTDLLLPWQFASGLYFLKLIKAPVFNILEVNVV